MRQYLTNQVFLDAQVERQREARLQECIKLFSQLGEKYGRPTVLDLVRRECDISEDVLNRWLFKRHQLPDGNAKRVYCLLDEVSKRPRPEDFPEGPLVLTEPIQMVDKVKAPPATSSPRQSRPKKSSAEPAGKDFPDSTFGYRKLNAAEIKQLLNKLQQPGGSILPEYKQEE